MIYHWNTKWHMKWVHRLMWCACMAHVFSLRVGVFSIVWWVSLCVVVPCLALRFLVGRDQAECRKIAAELSRMDREACERERKQELLAKISEAEEALDRVEAKRRDAILGRFGFGRLEL